MISSLSVLKICSDITYLRVSSQLVLVLFSSYLSITLCFLFLVYASWSDVKTGTVPNKLWLIAGIGGCLLCFCKCVLFDQIRILVTTAFSLAVAFSLSLGLFKMKLFGGADAKALTTMSIFVPTVIPLLPSSTFPLLVSLSTIVNLMVFVILVYLVNFSYNLFGYLFGEEVLRVSRIRSMKKFPLLVAYRKMPLHIQGSKGVFHLFSGRSEAPLTLVIIEHAQDIKCRTPNGELDNMSPKCPIAEAWTPLRIPIILLLTLSLFTSLLFGDLFLLFMR